MYFLDNFAYNPGDCLFDAFQVLLHYKYTSIELRECIIEHFKTCLQRNDNDALVSYEHELNAQSLVEMHNVTDPEIYLQRMKMSAPFLIPPEHRGLWGDIFCIKWLSKWLKISIRVWSSMNKKIYLHFNSTLSKNTYDILFHDQNPLGGNFQPLLCKRQSDMNDSHENNENLMRYENIKQQWTKI